MRVKWMSVAQGLAPSHPQTLPLLLPTHSHRHRRMPSRCRWSSPGDSPHALAIDDPDTLPADEQALLVDALPKDWEVA